MSIFFKHKEKKSCFLAILLFFIASTSLFAMENTYVIQQQLKGKVTDESGEPLPGVSVIIKGTKMGTQTDFDGKYIISVKESDVLVFSYVGMQTQEISVEDKTSLDVVLSEVSSVLEDIVVVGYGTQSKAKIVGTQSEVKSESIRNRGVVSLGEALRGLAPNLNISPISGGNGGGGEPGAGVNINIRGYASINSSGGGSPLILIDGMEQDINTLDPNDISNITVLEDVSASAIYGARAAFGVILIETKSGESGAPKVTISSSVVAAQFRNHPVYASSLDYAIARNEAATADPNPDTGQRPNPTYDKLAMDRIRERLNQEPIAEADDDKAPWGNGNGRIDRSDDRTYHNVDHFKNTFKETSYRFQNNVSVSGGINYGGNKEKKIQYSIYASLFHQGGQYRLTKDGYERKVVGLILDSNPYKWLNTSLNLRYHRRDKEFPVFNRFSQGWAQDQGIVYHMIFGMNHFSPLYQRMNDGKLGYIYDTFNAYMEQAYTGRTIRDGLSMLAKIELEPIENWKTILRYRYRSNKTYDVKYLQSSYSHYLDGRKVEMQPTVAGRYTTYYNDTYYISPQVYSQYELKLPKHYAKIMVGFEQEAQNYWRLQGRRQKVAANEVPSLRTATGEQTNSERKSHWSTRSIFGRITYTFDEKYVVSGTFRRDGSSRFAPEKRWGNFYSYGVAYNMHKEAIFADALTNAKINSLKLRFASGQIGNQDIGLYQFIERIPIGTQIPWLREERDSYANPPSLINKDATWETVQDYNYGIQTSALQNRLSLDFNYFIRQTKDMLGPVAPLPSTLGASVPRANSAELETVGWGLTVGWNDTLGDFNYDLKFMLSDAQSTITKYYNPTNVISDWYVGQKYGEIWGYETVKIMDKDTAAKVEANSAASSTKGTPEFPNQNRFSNRWGEGDILYKDLDGDGKITNGDSTVDKPGDRKIIGNSTPRYNYSFDSTFGYKGFTLRLFFQGVGSRQVGISGEGHPLTVSGNAVLLANQLDYWREDNKGAFYPRPLGRNRQRQSKYLGDASYFRLKSLTLSYSFDRNLLSNIKFDSASVFFSTDNLFTITKMPTHLDPELTSGFWGGSVKSYPLYRTYSVGLNVSF